MVTLVFVYTKDGRCRIRGFRFKVYCFGIMVKLLDIAVVYASDKIHDFDVTFNCESSSVECTINQMFHYLF